MRVCSDDVALKSDIQLERCSYRHTRGLPEGGGHPLSHSLFLGRLAPWQISFQHILCPPDSPPRGLFFSADAHAYTLMLCSKCIDQNINLAVLGRRYISNLSFRGCVN